MQYTAHPKDQRIIRLLRIAPAGAAVVALIMALVILVDWMLPRDGARQIQPGEYSMLPWAAILFVLVSASLFLQWRREQGNTARTIAWVLAGISALVSVIFLFEWITGLNVGIDTLLFHDTMIARGGPNPGRIANNGAAVFLFESLGLLLLANDRKQGRYKAQMFAFAGLLVATIALAGYLFDVPVFYAPTPGMGMALFTALLHAFVCFGLFMAQTDRGLPAILVDEGAAGILARRVMPPAVFIPLMFGWLRLHGEDAGYFNTRLGISLYAVADMAAILALVGWSARVVRLTDASRNKLLLLEQDARAGAELARSEAEHARAEAERANNAKSEFLAVMSHELRTPLTAIIGYEELLSDGITGPVNESQKSQLSRIKASAGHLLELIDQILGFARADVGREKVNVQEVKLTEMLRSAAGFVEPMAAAKKISLTIKLPDEEIVLRTDPGKVMQIVVNLLGNAVKFTDRGGVTLRAETRNGAAIVDVIDTGVGIAPEHIEQVFEPFWQVEQAITRRTGGTGLGLSVSRRLALMLDGDVTVSSTVGEGSKFTLILPLEPKQQTDAHSERDAQQTPNTMKKIFLIASAVAGLSSTAAAQTAPLSVRYHDAADKIIATSVADSSAYNRIAKLTDTFGHRISGSASLEHAIDWILAEMKADGLQNVHGEKVMVPHWVRGNESATLITPRLYTLHMIGLGRSIGTPRAGITAPVLVVSSYADLTAKAAQAKGKIVLFNVPFTSYGQTVRYRGAGADSASKVGAVAMLLRSVSSGSMQNPHTGAMNYDSTGAVKKIPAAAISVEDALMLSRMAARGEKVTVNLKMEARTFPDVPSRNVVGELVGSEKPDEVVVLGGHIDSWDIGTGAMDDAGGAVAAWEAVRLIKRLGLKPKRTLRIVMWTNEEYGLRGGNGYRDAHRNELDKHMLAMESDGGVFKPEGFGASTTPEGMKMLTDIASLLDKIGASKITEGGADADTGPIISLGVPGLSLNVDGTRYFWYHHSAADMVDKLDPREVAECVAAMAVMSYVVADMPETLPRNPLEVRRNR